MAARPDRTGEVWEAKPRKHQPPTGPLRILGWILVPEAGLFEGLWVTLHRSIFGRPFLGTVSEDTLRRSYLRLARAGAAA